MSTRKFTKAQKIIRLLYLMDEKLLHLLYINALNML